MNEQGLIVSYPNTCVKKKEVVLIAWVVNWLILQSEKIGVVNIALWVVNIFGLLASTRGKHIRKYMQVSLKK